MPLVLAAVLAALLLGGCDVKRLQRELVEPGRLTSIDHRPPYLKAHLRDGRVLVLSEWSAEGAGVRGTGRMFDTNRNVVAEGALSVGLDQLPVQPLDVAAAQEERNEDED